jgi:hypothetical protein
VLAGRLDAAAARLALAGGDAAGAVTYAQRALATLTGAPAGTSVLPTQTFLARSLNSAGRFQEALAAAERSLALAESRGTRVRHAAPVGTALLEIATAKHGLGDGPGARAALDRALDHLRASTGTASPATMRAEELRRQLTAAG